MSKFIKREDMTPEQLAAVEALIAATLATPAFAVNLGPQYEGAGKTPWNPSWSATLRVPDPMAIPTVCTCCGGASVECVHHEMVYGQVYGEWPWMLRCGTCDATVGLHPFTNIPLGTLATRVMRNARKAAKESFNKLWSVAAAMGTRSLALQPAMTRSEAYAWLAAQLGISNVKDCHIGWFGVEQCQRVVEVCDAWHAERSQVAFAELAAKRAEREANPPAPLSKSARRRKKLKEKKARETELARQAQSKRDRDAHQRKLMAA